MTTLSTNKALGKRQLTYTTFTILAMLGSQVHLFNYQEKYLVSLAFATALKDYFDINRVVRVYNQALPFGVLTRHLSKRCSVEPHLKQMPAP
jgi:hypothetical protein